ncbi:MAG TPA: sigma-70 family RNA polymerase sigma factor [Propionibacteriaceae bacterium]|jgi:RNA polymerase sigma-B factor|nr:sigma-70 family RNA polymerase sigma factor [Propionibacteriaceae bacterium]
MQNSSQVVLHPAVASTVLADGQNQDGKSPQHAQRQELADRTHALLIKAREVGEEERQQIFDEVVTSHLWLAETLSRRFLHRGEDEEDLLQVARTGLVEAAQRFDPEQGAFIAFAVPTITGVLKRHFRDHGWMVRPPRRTQELASGIWQQWPALVQTIGAIPSAKDLANQLGESVGAVQQARYASHCYSPASIEAAVARGMSFSSTESEEEIDRTEVRLIVSTALDQLTDCERQLLWYRFYEQRSQAEIAAAIGTSQMQVSRLLCRVLGKLRSIIGTVGETALAS